MDEETTILIIDDEVEIGNYLKTLITQFGYRAEIATSGRDGLQAIQRVKPQLVILDVVMPDMDGLEVLKRIQEEKMDTSVIMLSGHRQTSTVVGAMKLGATDFLNKPFDPDELQFTISKVLERRELISEVQRLKKQVSDQNGNQILFGNSDKMGAIKEIIDQVADTDITILIRGESGTGKGMIARFIYMNSSRRDRHFVNVNCAALPGELLESELFGYERGAFTGAHKKKPGKFEFANHGTIFLDEVGEIPLPLQAKLLQVLQDGEFSPLGSEQDVRVDARVIAASNRDLEADVAQGKFREDLYFRLNVVNITVPPLRERIEEIPILTEHFLQKYNRKYNKDYKKISKETIALFMQYNWPGNVRELENMIKRVVVLESEKPIVTEFLLKEEEKASQIQKNVSLQESGRKLQAPSEFSFIDPLLEGRDDNVTLREISKEASQRAEKELIEKILKQTNWNRKRTAEILQVSYKALLYKIKENKIDKFSDF
ncbi:MAG: sigma-54 dependent transcriptional regulator [bacterium]